MSELGPDDIELLLGAYALDAVDDDERRVVESYLSTHPRARAEVQQHREVATMLAFTGAPAPEQLWDRIAASLDGQAPSPGPELAKVLPAEPKRRRVGWWTAGIVAAAAAIVVGLLSFGYVERGRELDRARRDAVASVDLQRMMAQALTDPAARLLDLRSDDATLTARAVIEPNGTGYLAAQNLPELTDGDYQLWGVIDGQVISLGVLGSRPEVATFTASDGLQGLVITREAPGGVPVSKQPAALQGELI